MELTTYNEEVFSISRLFSSNIFPVEKPQNASFDSNPGGGGGLPYETYGDARRLALGCKLWILVSLRVFWAKRQYFKPPRSRLGFREEAQNYAKRNRNQIFFLTLFVMSLYH